MENSKLARLTLFAEQTWFNLSPDERENYYNDTGIIGFIEDCMKILRIYPSEIAVEQVDFICNRILTLTDDTIQRDIYGSYIPTDDITVIFEQWLDEDGQVCKLMVRGFYYGKPNDEYNWAFYRDYEVHLD